MKWNNCIIFFYYKVCDVINIKIINSIYLFYIIVFKTIFTVDKFN
jgi:hypothetical protein